MKAKAKAKSSSKAAAPKEEQKKSGPVVKRPKSTGSLFVCLLCGSNVGSRVSVHGLPRPCSESTDKDSTIDEVYNC